MTSEEFMIGLEQIAAKMAIKGCALSDEVVYHKFIACMPYNTILFWTACGLVRLFLEHNFALQLEGSFRPCPRWGRGVELVPFLQVGV